MEYPLYKSFNDLLAKGETEADDEGDDPTGEADSGEQPDVEEEAAKEEVIEEQPEVKTESDLDKVIQDIDNDAKDYKESLHNMSTEAFAKERNVTYAKFHQATNMSVKEMESWKDGVDHFYKD